MLEAKKGISPEIINFEKNQSALTLYMEKGMIRIIPVNAGIIRISMTFKEKFSDNPGVGVLPYDGINDFDVSDGSEYITLETEKLSVRILKSTGAISYYDKNGKLLLCERENDSKLLEPFQTYKTIIDENAVISEIDTPDGKKNVIEYATRKPDKEMYHTQVYINWQDGEVLYGLGQYDDGVFNLRGKIRYLHQANLKIAIPMMMSAFGYGLLIPTGSPAVFSDLPYEESYFYTEADEELNYYFIYGPGFDDIIGGYRKLSGKASMLPKWMFGYVQSQERYETADEIVSIAKGLRDREIGADVIVQDWFYWNEGLWGQKSYDSSRYPDPKGMIDKLHDMDFSYMISIWPNMNKDCDNYKEMDEAGLLFPASDVYDAFDEKGREIYWKQAYDGLYKYGVDAWWCDSCEPFTPEWARNPKPVALKMYEDFLRQTQQVMPSGLGNAYGLYHALGMYEGQISVSPDKRVVNLMRNGYTGSQRYGVILWSGDIYSSWDTYKKQIASGLNLCASGIPYWTFDIGGFFVKNGDFWYWSGQYEKGTDDLGYRELYVRWYQFGAFLPIFRAHGTDFRREPWQFGDEGTPFYDALVKINRLRYRLLPYIYSCAGHVWESDFTIMRLLAFDFAKDENTWLIDDQYMFGNDIMVCPVTEPMYYGKDSVPVEDSSKTRKVYLPAGTSWYDFWTDKKYGGGHYIEADAPLDKIPLFIREGSIIPMASGDIINVKQLNDTGIDVHVYPGRDVCYRLYEDAGEGYEYEAGDFCIRNITWDDKKRSLEVEDAAGKPWMLKINDTVVH